MVWTKSCIVGLLGLTFVIAVCAPQPAAAISAELAKKCREKAFKAHPRVTTGSKTTNAKAQQDYFRNCLAKNGNVD